MERNRTEPVTEASSETAASVMQRAIPTIEASASIGEARNRLTDPALPFASVAYLYLVNEQEQVVSVASLHDILSHDASLPLQDIATAPVVKVSPHTDQEHVVATALGNNIKAVPVLDEDGRALGVVTADTIMRILHQEHLEDLQRLSGVVGVTNPDRATTAEQAIGARIRSRLPWLMLGLLGGLGAALVVSRFESILQDELLLAAFIPAVVYIADAVGAQTQLLFIRASSVQKLSLRDYLARELGSGLVIGGILALTIGCVTMLWFGIASVSLILATAIFLTVHFSVLVAILLPWTFARAGYDPAIASGPLATVIRDISSLGIYLAVATMLL